MHSNLLRTGVILGLLALAGCQKKDGVAAAVDKAEQPAKPIMVETVKTSERSRHFEAVNRELELGGTLYGYADVDGDVLGFAAQMQALMKQLAGAQPQLAPYVKDYAPVIKALGLDDIKAMGLSSVAEGDGYFRNRVFLYTPGPRHGLLAGLGGPSAPFVRLGLAPADTDFYAESEIDLPAVYATIHDVVAKVGGENSANQFELALKNAGKSAAISVLSMIQGWKGHMAVVERFDGEKTMQLPVPGGAALPAFSMLVSIDGLAPAVKDALAKSPVFALRQVGTLQIFDLKQPLPVESLKPIFVIDGSTLVFATSEAFFNECRQPKKGLAQQPEFQQALAQVGKEGNGLVYISPHFFARLHQLGAMNPHLPAEMQRSVQMVLNKLPVAEHPLVTVRTNLPDGILFRSHWNRSLKQDVAMVAFYNPVTVGVLAAMAIPAFQKVRTASQEKTVLNNLRQLAAAADQYYLEKGVDTATYEDLVGPDKYVRVILPVDGEDYKSLVFKQGQSLEVHLLSGKVIKYP